MFESESENGNTLPADLTARNIRTIDQCLDLIAKAIFASGLSWSVVEGTWPATREAFRKFSAAHVAAMSDHDLEALRDFDGVISNPSKLAAVRGAAQVLLERRAEHRSIGSWLTSLENFDRRQSALREMSFIGPFGAYYVLSVAGYDVPEYQIWRQQYSSVMRAG